MGTPVVIVVGADLNETGDEAIRVGLEQLAGSAAQGMYVVHVIAHDPVAPARAEGAADADAESIKRIAEALAQRIDAIAKREELPYYEELVRVEVRRGEVQRALLTAAHEHQAELLIVGTHGRTGMDRLFAGSMAETLVRHATCSVLIARPRTHVRRTKREAMAHRDYSTYRFEPALLARREPGAHEQGEDTELEPMRARVS